MDDGRLHAGHGEASGRQSNRSDEAVNRGSFNSYFDTRASDLNSTSQQEYCGFPRTADLGYDDMGFPGCVRSGQQWCDLECLCSHWNEARGSQRS